MRTLTLWLCLLLLVLFNGSCAFHKKATDWNGLVGSDGKEVHLNSTTKVGFNALVFFPFVGDIGLDGMVEDATEEIREDGGDYARVVETRSDNYWYALPPITWVVTPVVRSLTVEYRPGTETGWLSQRQEDSESPNSRQPQE